MTSFSLKLRGFAQHIRSFVRSSYFVVIAEVFLMTLLTLSSFSILVRLTDVKVIGFWVLLNSILSFSKVADFWSAGLVTFVAEDIQRGQVAKACRLVSTSMLTAAAGFLAVALVAGLAIGAFAHVIPGIEEAGLVRAVVPLMCLTFWLISLAGTYQIGFLGFNKPVFKLVQNVSGSLLFLILSLVLVPAHGLWGILIAQAAQGAFQLAFGLIAFHLVLTKSVPLVWNYGDFAKLSHYGSKATVVGFLQLATDPLIRVLASHFGGLSAVTLIELATRMIVAVRGLIMSVGQLLVPAFARASVQDRAHTAKLYADARQVFVAITVPVLSCLLSAAPFLERLMLGQSSFEFLPMVWLLSLGWGVNIITAPAFFLLSGRRQLRPLFWNRLLMLVAVLLFGVTGGAFFGILGVAAGVAIGLVAASLVVFRAAREFEPASGSGLKFRLLLIGPILSAAISSFCFLSLASLGYSNVVLALSTLLGLIATVAVSFAVTPLDVLLRLGVVNAEKTDGLI